MPRKKKEVLDEIQTRIIGSDLLSDEEKEQTLKRAAEHVKEARKKKATDELFTAAVRETEREYDPLEAMEDFHVELPEYTPFIKLNNVVYFHGLVYEISYSRARDMAHLQWCAWQHQNEIDGKRRHGDLVRKPLHMMLSPSNPQGVTTTQSLRARA